MSNDFLMWTAFHSSRLCPFPRLFFTESMADPRRNAPYLMAVSCNFFHCPRGKRTRRIKQNRPCVCMQCHGQAVCQDLLLSPHPRLQKANPSTAFTSIHPPLHPPVRLILSSESWQTQKETERPHVPMNVHRLDQGDDEDGDRAEVKDEGK